MNCPQDPRYTNFIYDRTGGEWFGIIPVEKKLKNKILGSLLGRIGPIVSQQVLVLAKDMVKEELKGEKQ